jgi:hypothetical protein
MSSCTKSAIFAPDPANEDYPTTNQTQPKRQPHSSLKSCDSSPDFIMKEEQQLRKANAVLMAENERLHQELRQ